MGSLPWPFGRGSKKKEKKREEPDEGILQEFGVTEQLRDFLKGFTIDTFKGFPLRDDQTMHPIEDSAPMEENFPNIRKDLTEWQEQHATLVLSIVKEISQLRYVLCPRYLKEKQFWSIYFVLVKSYVVPYEINAIKKAKLKRMGLEHENSMDKAAIEVEMIETKHPNSGSSITMEHDSTPLPDGDRSKDEPGEAAELSVNAN